MPCDILILDDDPLVLMTLAAVLRDEGFEVEEAHSSAEAISRVQADGPPGVLVTDINLGENRTGLEVAKELRRTAPELPVIFMTGQPNLPSDKPLDQRQRLLRKPFVMSELVELVQEMQQAGRSPAEPASGSSLS